MSKVSRRSFIKKLAFSSGKETELFKQDVLVVVFLRGGADTLNFFIPHGDDEYYRARPTIGLKTRKNGSTDSELAIAVNDFYSFHPRLEPLMRYFKEDRLSIVQAVGSDNVSGSHFQAQDQMEHGESYKHSLQGGWLGRHLYYQEKATQSPLVAVAMGNRFPESLRGAPQASAIQSIEDIDLKFNQKSMDSAVACLNSLYSNCGNELGHAGLDTLSLLKKIERVRSKKYRTNQEADYPDDEFGKSLIEVARIIKGNLGMQIACVDSLGWDTHFVQGGASGIQAAQIDSLAKGLHAFCSDLDSYRDSVNILVMTEFGRRSYENSSLGTDHGRGFSAFLISDKIEGGKFYGNYPGIDEEGLETILGPAGLAIKIDYRDILWEIIQGILKNENVGKVFPNLKHKKINLVKGL